MKTQRSIIPDNLLAIVFAAVPLASAAQFDPCVSAAVSEPPPAIPANQQQPPAPAPNDLWNPGYWAWNSYGYIGFQASGSCHPRSASLDAGLLGLHRLGLRVEPGLLGPERWLLWWNQLWFRLFRRRLCWRRLGRRSVQYTIPPSPT